MSKKILCLCLCLCIATTNIYCHTILLTGGAGFIGSHVTEYLLARGDKVIVVDEAAYDKRNNLKEANIKALPMQLKIYAIDIRDTKELEQIFINEQPTKICHLAARAGTRHSTEIPEEYLSTNILGTLNIFELAKKYNINHIVYASSSSVYGNVTEIPFHETEVINKPLNVYAMSKASCELLAYVYFYLHGIQSTGLRFFTVYGPRVRTDLAPYIFMDAICHNKPINLFGDGSIQRDFTYIEDIVTGIVAALDKPLGYEVLNLGRSQPVNVLELIHVLEKTIGKQAQIHYMSPRPEDATITFADTSKAFKLLGYKPKTTLQEGINYMYQWYHSHKLKIISRTLDNSNEYYSYE